MWSDNREQSRSGSPSFRNGNRAMTLADIRSDFALLDDWEDRYRYVIELGRGLAPLPEGARNEANKVRGCASQVWLSTSVEAAPNGTPRLRFVGDSDAHIVRGLIAILLAVYDGKSADEILGTDAQAVFADLGLKEHLTPQRSNGLASMVERIRRDATAAQTAA
jgi:cysteine desulfuration protein SufE